MRTQRTFINPELTKKEALKLVKMIKAGSDYAGILVMLSIARTLKYVSYTKASYSWKKKKEKVRLFN